MESLFRRHAVDVLDSELVQQCDEGPLTFGVADVFAELKIFNYTLFASYKFLILVSEFDAVPALQDDLVDVAFKNLKEFIA